jgi:cation diffusion facilitator family transporter
MPQTIEAQREKSVVALSSVGAAIGLTSMKLLVGLLTGSLGILAETAHSGLDLVAALMTFFAVRIASRPADMTHHYGHGKVENLSAFLEAGLLMLTALWVIYEAVQRLIFNEGHLELSIWAFIVMAVSIIVDYTRSRVLLRVARRVGSQALEADALHFSTDIWSSSVVIAGLAVVALTQHFPLPVWMKQADAIAALGVSGIVIWVSTRLLRDTVDALLDHAPTDLTPHVQAEIAKLTAVVEVRRVRLRRAGNKFFADVVVTAPRTASFAQTHSLTEEIEQAVQRAIQPTLPQADIDTVVHVEPAITQDESVQDRISFIASQQHLQVHDIHVRDVNGRLEVDFDMELPGDHSLQEAHGVASQLEVAIQADNPSLSRVTSHIESPVGTVVRRQEITSQYPELSAGICRIVDSLVDHPCAHDIHLYHAIGQESAADPGVDLVLHATFPATMNINQVHTQAEAMKRALREAYPDLEAITIHEEPPEE